MNTRKNQSTMTLAEKTAFVSAVVKLKTAVPSQIGLTNRYDDYVQIHMDSMMLPNGNDRVPSWAHRAPAFGPWHRALLRNFEVDLQQAANDPTLSLPYWDWTVANTNGSGPGSPWTDDFMGKMDSPTATVTSGPFRQGVWTLNVLEPQDTGTSLTRALGRASFQPSSPPFPITTLPTALNVQNALLETPYDSAPWQMGDTPSFRDRLEGWHGAGSIHNRVHLWVSGSMLPSTSPNDPIFFLHHCNIDRLWAHWQHPAGSAARPYVPAAGTANAPVGHRLGDPMQPWGGSITVDSTLDHHGMGYRYDDEAALGGPFLVAPPVLSPATTAPPLVFPLWQHKVQKHHHHRPMMMMFDISPEDKRAGGHDLKG